MANNRTSPPPSGAGKFRYTFDYRPHGAVTCEVVVPPQMSVAMSSALPSTQLVVQTEWGNAAIKLPAGFTFAPGESSHG